MKLVDWHRAIPLMVGSGAPNPRGPRLAIFPSLKAEDLVSSAVSRYADMMAFPDMEEALRQIFRFNPGDPDVELSDALQRFLVALPPGHGLTLRSLTNRHTALPCFSGQRSPGMLLPRANYGGAGHSAGLLR